MSAVSSAARFAEGLTPIMAGWSNRAETVTPSGRPLGLTYLDLH